MKASRIMRSCLLFLCLSVLLVTRASVSAEPTRSWEVIDNVGDSGIKTTFLSATDGWGFVAQSTRYNGSVEFFHWDGKTWTSAQKITDSRYYFAETVLYAVSNTDIWAMAVVAVASGATRTTAIWHYDGKSWSFFGDIVGVNIFDVDFLDAKNGWAVGNDDFDTFIYYWDGVKWSYESVTRGTIKSRAIDMISPIDGWTAGYDGILRKSMWGWASFPISKKDQLTDIAMITASDGWVAGNGGQLFHWNGTNWAEVPSPTIRNFAAITFRGSDNGWATTSVTEIQDQLYHYDGKQWVEETLPTPVTILDEMNMISHFEGYMRYAYYTEDPETYKIGVLHLSIEPTARVYLPITIR